MEIDINKKYFLMSFRFDKIKPEDFNMVSLPEEDNIYVNKEDNSLWIKSKLYDFGWGNENGFVRLPELKFNNLWKLLTLSRIQENKYGSAYFILKNYPDDLKTTLLKIINDKNAVINNSMKEVFKILKLDININKSPVLNKSIEQISKDYSDWQLITENVLKYLKL